MSKRKALYKSFLIRLSQDKACQPVHVRLEEVGTNANVYHFADLKSLLAFLQTQSLLNLSEENKETDESTNP